MFENARRFQSRQVGELDPQKKIPYEDLDFLNFVYKSIGINRRVPTVINQLVWTYQAYANVARKIVQMINIFGTNIKDKIFNQIRIKMENSNYKGGRNTIISTQKIV